MKRVNIFSALILFLYSSCGNKLKEISSKFGANQNPVRQKLHLVVVDPSYKLIEDASEEGRHFTFVNKHEPDISIPEFLLKSIQPDSSEQNISYEMDYFKNPIGEKYLIISHDYFNKSIDLDNRQTEVFLKAGK